MSYQIRGAFWIWFSIRPVWQFKACLLQQTNYLLSHFTILMDSNCSIKLPLVDIIWKNSIQKPSQQDCFCFFFGGSELRSVQRFHPSDFPTQKFRLMKDLQRSILRFKLPVATTIGTNYQGTKALGTNLGIILKQHGSTECDACYREPALPYFHIFWLIPPLEEFQMFSCS